MVIMSEENPVSSAATGFMSMQIKRTLVIKI